MNFEEFVPAAIVATVILGTWIDVRRGIGDVRRELFTLNGRVSHIEGLIKGLLSPAPPDSSAAAGDEPSRDG